MAASQALFGGSPREALLGGQHWGWKGGQGQRLELLQPGTGWVSATKAAHHQRVGVELRLPPPWSQVLGSCVFRGLKAGFLRCPDI